MTGVTTTRLRHLAAGLVVLAAIFHVQWLAACDVMLMAEQAAHCVQAQAGEMEHCGDMADAGGCELVLANGTGFLKLTDRVQGADELPDAMPWTGLSAEWSLRPDERPPHSIPPDAVIADGRSLYLTSSRLRL